jgi:hypothetical protein
LVGRRCRRGPLLAPGGQLAGGAHNGDMTLSAAVSRHGMPLHRVTVSAAVPAGAAAAAADTL